MKTKKKKNKYRAMAIIFLVLAATTVIPSPGASKPCPLGYYAHCSFTPYSTIILIGLAGLNFYRYSREKNKKIK